jgi:hypothetical protein
VAEREHRDPDAGERDGERLATAQALAQHHDAQQHVDERV